MSENAISGEELNALLLVSSVCLTDKDSRTNAMVALESELSKYDQLEIPVIHRFCGGMYSREIVIKKNTILTGRIHKFDHFDIMLSGDITVSSEGGLNRLTGLNIMEGKAGKKRAGYAHEDTHWITFHSAEERDPEQMYEFLTVETFAELDEFNVMLEKAMAEITESERILTESAEAIICQ